MSVKDIASWNIVIFWYTVYSITENTISEVQVSPSSAETLARRGGIRNKFLIVYFHNSISAKKLLTRNAWQSLAYSPLGAH